MYHYTQYNHKPQDSIAVVCHWNLIHVQTTWRGQISRIRGFWFHPAEPKLASELLLKSVISDNSNSCLYPIYRKTRIWTFHPNAFLKERPTEKLRMMNGSAHILAIRCWITKITNRLEHIYSIVNKLFVSMITYVYHYIVQWIRRAHPSNHATNCKRCFCAITPPDRLFSQLRSTSWVRYNSRLLINAPLMNSTSDDKSVVTV